MSKFSDESDKASFLEAMATEDSIRVVREKIVKATTPPSTFDGVSCVDCDEPVEPQRLNLGLFRCLSCQVHHEAKTKFFRGE